MFYLPVQTKHSLIPLLVVIISIVLALTEPMSNNLFAYDRNQLNHFQWWRLITGHFLHTNTSHLLLNLTGLTLLWALHGHHYKMPRYLIQFLVLCLGTSIGLYYFAHQMQWYVGLSGVLHGLFVIGAYFDIRQKLRSGWAILIGVWIKVIYEQVFGASADVAKLIEANVAVDAHLFGTITGCIIIMYYSLVNNTQLAQRNS
jgi:rhomboid family GlyGly-CTERM serine protease